MKKYTILFTLFTICMIVTTSLSLMVSCSDDDETHPTPTPTSTPTLTSTPTPALVTIVGTVYDGWYHPQANIRIICEKRETRTDVFGHYSLSDVSSGKKEVHAIWEFDDKPLILILTKVAKSNRFDFLFRDIMDIQWDCGTIDGTITGMSDAYSNRSGVMVTSVSEEGFITWNFAYRDTTSYSLFEVPVGNNFVIAHEDTYEDYRFVTQTFADSVLVNRDETTTQNLHLSPDGFEEISGSYNSIYKEYTRYVHTYLNIISPPFCTYFYQGGEILAGTSVAYPGENARFSYQALPNYCNSEKVTLVIVRNRVEPYYKMFFNCKKHTTGNVLTFPEEPQWIEVTSPEAEAENVGNYPLIMWQGDADRYMIWVFPYNNVTGAFIDWYIETTDNEYRIPKLADIYLTHYSDVTLSVMSKSSWGSHLATITPPLPEETEFLASDTTIEFYPGPETTFLPHMKCEKMKRIQDSKLKQQWLPGQTADGRYLYWAPVVP